MALAISTVSATAIQRWCCNISIILYGWCYSPNIPRAFHETIESVNGSGGSSQEAEFPERETYLLPLGACHGEDEEASRAGGYMLPIQCQVFVQILRIL